MEVVNDFKYIVYCTTNKVNGKIYIGTHKTYTNSFDGYLGCGVYVHKPNSYNQSKTIFQRAVQKYGPANFYRKTLAEFETEEDAMALEAELVNTKFLERDDVYNMILGGYGNKNMKPHCTCYSYDFNGNFVEEFISIRSAGQIFAKTNYAFNSIKNAIIDKVGYKNRYWSLVKYDVLDIADYSPDRRPKVKIYQYASTGEFEQEYASIAEACQANNTCSSSLVKACRLGYLSKGKYFSYEKYDQFSTAKLEYLKTVPIYCYDMEGNFVATYQNESEAKKALGIKGSIMKSLKLKCAYNEKYQFSFDLIPKMPNRKIGEKRNTAKAIDQYDLEGNFIKTWPSIRECCKSLHIQDNCITRILKGTQYKTKGFTFKYHEVKDIV